MCVIIYGRCPRGGCEIYCQCTPHKRTYPGVICNAAIIIIIIIIMHTAREQRPSAVRPFYDQSAVYIMYAYYLPATVTTVSCPARPFPRCSLPTLIATLTSILSTDDLGSPISLFVVFFLFIYCRVPQNYHR